MNETIEITEKINLTDFRSSPSNKALVKENMESNYVCNITTNGIEVILPNYFLEYSSDVLTEAVFNVLRMENDRRRPLSGLVTDDAETMRNRLYELRTTKKFRYT